MSEHRSRSRRTRTFSFPAPVEDYDDEAETAAFVERIIAETMPRFQYFSGWLDDAKRFGIHHAIDPLFLIERETFDVLTLIWMGLPPRQADEFVERLAPWWAEFTALMAHNAQRAKAMLARHGEVKARTNK